MDKASVRAELQTCLSLQAAVDGDLRVLKKMAEQIDLALVEDPDGANPLHLAAHEGHLECCMYLVEKIGIDVDSTTRTGTTPLVYALLEGHVQVLMYLLGCGGSSKRKTAQRLTLLHAAASRGLCGPLELLLSIGNPADVMLVDHGGAPLHAAAAAGHDEAIKILLEHGADSDVNGRFCGPTPLTQAVKEGMTDIVKLLLEAGADPNSPGEDGEIPIQLAARGGNRDLVQVLFSKTIPVPSLPYWSVDGIIRMTESSRIRRQHAVPVGERITYLKSRAKEAFAKKDYHAALYFFGRVIEINPFDATMFSNRSLCWLRMREGERALSDAQHCRKHMPGWCKAWYLEGTALSFVEDYQGAADAFMEALKLDPQNVEIKRALGEAMESKRSASGSEDRKRPIGSLARPMKMSWCL